MLIVMKHILFLVMISSGIQYTLCMEKDERLHSLSYQLLNQAVISGFANIVESVLEAHPALLNEKNELGSTSLAVAVFWKHSEVVKVLLSKNADSNIANNQQKIPLHIAVEAGNKKMVKLLLRAGSYINYLDRYQRSALHVATEAGYVEIVKLLLRKGANRFREDTYHKTPLRIAVERAKNTNDLRYYTIVELLEAYYPSEAESKFYNAVAQIAADVDAKPLL